jgi:NitT/TauT family transport system ATP-binding protein
MDEPFASLDALTREQLYRDLQAIQAAQRRTVILVTHNVREAACLGDRVILLSPHPGRIREEFRVDLRAPGTSTAWTWAAGSIMAALKGHLGPQEPEGPAGEEEGDDALPWGMRG